MYGKIEVFLHLMTYKDIILSLNDKHFFPFSHQLRPIEFFPMPLKRTHSMRSTNKEKIRSIRFFFFTIYYLFSFNNIKTNHTICIRYQEVFWYIHVYIQHTSTCIHQSLTPPLQGFHKFLLRKRQHLSCFDVHLQKWIK